MVNKKIQLDQASRNRNKIILIFLAIGSIFPAILRTSVQDDKGIGAILGYFTGYWIMTLAFTYLFYFLGRWKLKPTLAENKNKFIVGAVLGGLFILFVLFASYNAIIKHA